MIYSGETVQVQKFSTIETSRDTNTIQDTNTYYTNPPTYPNQTMMSMATACVERFVGNPGMPTRQEILKNKKLSKNVQQDFDVMVASEAINTAGASTARTGFGGTNTMNVTAKQTGFGETIAEQFIKKLTSPKNASTCQ